MCVSVGNGNGVSNISSHTGFIVDFELCARDFAAALVTINSLCVLTMLDWVEAVAMATSASRWLRKRDACLMALLGWSSVGGEWK